MKPAYSFIVPVYNRPDEVRELLNSLAHQSVDFPFEVVLIEDGSTDPCQAVAEEFSVILDIAYYLKKNTGPGDSRNYGMYRAKAEFFIILDSDVLLPEDYLKHVNAFLQQHPVDCFGGPDAAHPEFNALQKAISFVMTSWLTTGGIRGSKKNLTQFQPRSFNMGLSKKAFMATGGFSNLHPGEDPELVFKLWDSNFKTTFIDAAVVYHKRRISWHLFFKQVLKFGKVRPILQQQFPHYRSPVFWLPVLFSLGLVVSIILAIFFKHLVLLSFYGMYFLLIFVVSTTAHNLKVGMMSTLAVLVQQIGYAWGFVWSSFYLYGLKKNPQEAFPELYFKK
ncbi:MAG: glycosyltransferase [Flavobacteriaceae bacterium]|nr:glycosyltransferase [Flavobacteriaceae bacterium]